MRKKLLLLFAVLATAINASAENYILYTSLDGNVVEPYKTDVFGANIVSNTYENGQGKIVFDGEVTKIGERAFWRCSSLTLVAIPNSVTTIEREAYYNCTYLTSVVIPDSVTTIGIMAFANCYSLTSVTIPNSVTTIGEHAFDNCSGLTSVTIENNDPAKITLGNGVFYKVPTSTCILKVPAGSKELYAAAEQWKEFQNIVEFSNSSDEENNIIYYTSSDGNVVTPYATDFFGANIVSNTYENGQGKIVFDGDVTSIGEGAFRDHTKLKSVVIPNSVTSIGSEAFYGCTHLTSVAIPNSVTSIGESAFYGCVSLSSFTGKFASDDHRCLIVDGVLNSFARAGLTTYEIPNSVTEIGKWAFGGCISLKSVVIPNSVTKIGYVAFSQCTNLTSVTIGNSVTTIGVDAFSDCSSLTSVEIPNSVTEIEKGAFSVCSSLTSVVIGNSVTTIGEGAFRACRSLESFSGKFASEDQRCLIVDGVLNYFARAGLTTYEIPNSVTTIGKDAFSDCSSLTSVTIPNSVKKIRRGAFQHCSGLTSVTIPNSVIEIEMWAFYYCYGLTSLTVENSDPENITLGYEAFRSVPWSTCILYVPAGSKELYAVAYIWRSFLNIEEFSSNGEENNNVSENQIIYYTSSDGNVVTPYATDVFGANIVSNTYEDGQGKIVFDGDVTSIGNWAFYNCSNLTSLTIPNSVTTIGGNAFAICEGLTSVEIPNSVTMIGGNAFLGCRSLTSVEIPNSVTTIDNYAFQLCLNLKSVEIPNSVTTIGGGVFRGCTKINSFTGKFATEDHRLLIVDGVLKSFAPAGLTSYEIPNSVTSIGNSSFHKCSLTSVKIPNSVTTIEDYAFETCFDLTSVEIPNSVTKIGRQAFINCSGLTSVTVENSDPASITLGESVFDGVPYSTCVLYVPAGSKELYAAADQWKEFQNIVEMVTIDAVTDKTTVSTESLIEQDLTDNVVDNVYYNLNDEDSGIDPTDGSIVIGSTTNMDEIEDKEPGSADVAQNFNGLILKVAKDKGTITVNMKTTGNAQLVVQVGNLTTKIATRAEKGDVMVSYDVEEDTYVYIYALFGSNARTRGEAAEDDAVKIYGIKITPGVVSDINGDGNVDISDVVVLVNMVLEENTDAVGDINGDGTVDISDVVTLVNMILE